EVAHVAEDLVAHLGQVVEAGAGADGALAADERGDDDEDEQAEVGAADEQVAPPPAAGLDDAEQDRVRGDESPGVVGYSEHHACQGTSGPSLRSGPGVDGKGYCTIPLVSRMNAVSRLTSS